MFKYLIKALRADGKHNINGKTCPALKHLNRKHEFLLSRKRWCLVLCALMPAMDMVEADGAGCVDEMYITSWKKFLLLSYSKSPPSFSKEKTHSNCLICYMFLEVGCGGKEAMPRVSGFEIISNINNYPQLPKHGGKIKYRLLKSCQCSLACK